MQALQRDELESSDQHDALHHKIDTNQTILDIPISTPWVYCQKTHWACRRCLRGETPPTIVHVLHDVQHDNVMMCVNQLGAHVDAEADCLGTELAMI